MPTLTKGYPLTNESKYPKFDTDYLRKRLQSFWHD